MATDRRAAKLSRYGAWHVVYGGDSARPPDTETECGIKRPADTDGGWWLTSAVSGLFPDERRCGKPGCRQAFAELERGAR